MSILTIKQKVALATAMINDLAINSNSYIGIGKVAQWSNGDVLIPEVDNSVDSQNFVFDNLVALKKITASDMALVVPRIDWYGNTVYSAYSNTVDTFTTILETPLSGNVSGNDTSTIVVGTNTSFTTDFSVGNFIKLVDTSNNNVTIKEIISINSNSSLSVNSPFGGPITTNTYYYYQDNYPFPAYAFYVRNSYDQVFKCLDNNDGAPSTIMPQISLGGQLPSDPYIETSDGYKWKYLYTIPSGLKQRFFTNWYMPVVNDPVVVESSVGGRIDIFDIVDGGIGYNSNVTSYSANIITILGNGTGANVTAVVNSSGTITDVNILDGGSGYTYASVSVAGGSSGYGANITPIISPEGGHGSNNFQELGATTLMLCPELEGTEGGYIPIGSSGTTNPFVYHQVSIIKNPLETSGNIASNAIYNTTTAIYTAPVPSGSLYQMDDTAYQGTSLAAATFTGTIVNWDNVGNIVYLNNIRGNFTPYSGLSASLLNIPVTAFSKVNPPIAPYTGDILYVQNRPGVSRSASQTEQIRVILEI